MQAENLDRVSSNVDDLENATETITPDELIVVFGILDMNGERKISKNNFVNAVYIQDKAENRRRHRRSTGYENRAELMRFIHDQASDGNRFSFCISDNDDDDDGGGSDAEYNSDDVPSSGTAAALKEGWQESLVQNISNFLFQSRIHFGAIFRAFDKNNDGFISETEFKDALHMMNYIFSNPLTDDQVSPASFISLITLLLPPTPQPLTRTLTSSSSLNLLLLLLLLLLLRLLH